MRILVVILLFTFSLLAQISQPKIIEFRENISLSQLEGNGFSSFSGGEGLMIDRAGAKIESGLKSFPKTENAPFIAMAVSVKGSFNGGSDLSFTLVVDGVSEELQPDEDADPVSSRAMLVSQLFFALPGAKNYKVIVKANRGGAVIRSIEVVLINPGKSVPVEPEITQSPADSYPKPPVVSRTGWGCPIGQNTNCGNSTTTVTHLIVHHSAGSNSSSDWAAVLRSIYQLHTVTNGWCDVGYNYLIAPNGVIYEGRGGGDNVVGAHFCGYNGGTMGVCMLGTYTSVSPPAALLSSLSKILAWKADQRGINPLGVAYHPSSGLTINNITGHRVGCTTECPGDAFFNNDLANIRMDVLSLIQSLAPKVVSATPAGGSSGVKGYAPIQITFNLQMDTTSVKNAISISPVDTFKVSFTSSTSMVITPTGLWSASTQYTLKIDSTAKNIHGTPLDGDGNGVAGDPYYLTFTTAEPDNFAPKIMKLYPQGENISTYAEMMIVFDEEITNYDQNITLVDGSGGNITLSPFNYSWNGSKCVLTFKSTSLLPEGRYYTLRLASAISDRSGNRLGEDKLFDFHVPIVSFVEGTVVDRFEGITTWGSPLNTPGTAGIDTLLTGFSISSERKRGGIFSGKLTFGFTADAGGSVVIRKSTGHALPTGTANVGVWIFSQLNNNHLYALIQGSSEEMVDLGLLDNYGWKFIIVPVDNSAGGKQFKGFMVQQVSGADRYGEVFFDNLQLNGTFTGTEKDQVSPVEFTLNQNYPNPFNPETLIRFTLPSAGFVKGTVYDIMGSEVAVLINEELAQGQHSVRFDASSLSSGVYIFKLNAGVNTRAIKMIVSK